VIVGLGLDVVPISRIATMLARYGARLERRLFTDDERAYCRGRGVPEQHFAARFAAKEATLKALRLEDQGMDMRAIEVRQMPGGWSEIALSGRAQELAVTAGWSSWSVSLSHEGDYATAVVAAVIDPNHKP